MPKRKLTQSVTLVRDGQRVQLTAGETVDLSDDEINDIVAVSPGALSTTATVDLSKEEEAADEGATRQMTAAEKKAAEKAAKEAAKVANGPSTAGGADL